MKKLLALFFVLLFAPVFVLAADKVEINTASLEQLDQITGVGPVLAQRIVDARPFSLVDDLLRVSGIGEKTLQKIKNQGLAYVEGGMTQTTTKAPPVEEKLVPAPVVVETPVVAQPPPTYPAGVILNEVLPSPEGSDKTSEWIELYNTNDFSVDLSGWKLQDLTGTPTTYILPKNTTLSNNGYLVLNRPETKITLNNDEDGLSLASPDGKIVDSMSYTNALKNQSYNKSGKNWEWSATLTPGNTNIIATKTASALLKPKKTDNKTNIASASVSDSLGSAENPFFGNLEEKNTSNPWFLFLTALVITIFSVTIILFTKLKILKKQII